MRALLYALLTSLAMALFGLAGPGSAWAATYSADASAGNATTYPWIDTSTGTTLNLSDNGLSATVNIGFNFTLGTTAYASLRIDANGTVQFGGTVNTAVTYAPPLDGNGGKPNIDAVLMPLWDDLYPNNGDVSYKLTGTAPNRVFTITWNSSQYACQYNILNGLTCWSWGQTGWTSDSATFQVQLHETGKIVYRYGAVEGNGGPHGFSNPTNGGATIGIEVSNSDYTLYSRNTASIGNGTTIVWTTAPVLKAQWDMESISGSTTPDGSGNGNTLSLGATGTSLVGGAAGYGLALAGASPAAGSSAGAALTSNRSYTVSAWVKFSAMSNCQAQAVVSQDGSTAHPFEIQLIPGCGLTQSLMFDILATDADASAVKRVYSSFSPVVDTWYHVAGVYDSSAGTMAFYVNCNLQGTQTSVTSFAASGPFTVGRSRFSASSRDYLNGVVDGVKVWTGARSASDIGTECVNMPRPLLAEYRFDQNSWNGTAGEVIDSSGNGYHATAAGLSATTATTANVSPVVSTSPGTCSYGVFTRSNKQYVALPSSLPQLGSSLGFTVTAWFRTTDRTQIGQRIVIDDENNSSGFGLSLGDRGAGVLNFYSRKASTGSELLSGAVVANNTWYFVAISVDIDGQTKSLVLYNAAGTQLAAVSTAISTSIFANDSGIMSIGGETNGAGASEATSAYGFTGNIDEVRIYQNALSSTELDAVRQLTRTCPASGPDHLQIEHDGSALTCTPETVTVKACANSACSSLYASGAVTGTLGWSGVASGSVAFSISAGQSSTTVSVPVTAVGAVSLASSAVSPATTTSTTCLNTSTSAASCSLSFADTGLLFDVPDHRAEAANTVTVTAVKKADNSAACTPAFASVSKNVTFKCSYSNPGTGTLPVRMGPSGSLVALNSGNSTAAACDATGRAVSLAFNASGVASTTVQYADVGRVTLTGTYAGSGADAGLTMTGSDSFIAAPHYFTVSGITPGNLVAGSAFTASVTARNTADNTTPNFGRESSPESATLGFVRTQPQGSGASNGSFSGSLGSFASGVASASNLVWSEVGRGEVTALLASGSYLGSGINAAGASISSTSCAVQNATCTLPTGVTATVYYGYGGRYNIRTGVTGSITCNNTNFGDPWVGQGAKACSYFVTGGSSSASTGSAGPFIPHHFNLGTNAACGSFSYAGQAFTTTVTALNASGGSTVNYDGTANTSPNFAKATTLSEPSALGVGTLSGNNITASAFTAGVAGALPTYTFASKTTSSKTLGLRAIDADGVSSQNFTEGSMLLRSGRLRLSNAFGNANTSLQIPVWAEYWGGNQWVLNSADSCTSLAAASVVLSNPRSATGAASSASSSAGGLLISGGSGNLTLAAPSPAGSSLTLDLALNLGATSTDQSCQANHPSSTGAAKPWLRAQNGSCAASAYRDPAARASFGVFIPETRKTVHVREIF